MINLTPLQKQRLAKLSPEKQKIFMERVSPQGVVPKALNSMVSTSNDLTKESQRIGAVKTGVSVPTGMAKGAARFAGKFGLGLAGLAAKSVLATNPFFDIEKEKKQRASIDERVKTAQSSIDKGFLAPKNKIESFFGSASEAGGAAGLSLVATGALFPTSTRLGAMTTNALADYNIARTSGQSRGESLVQGALSGVGAGIFKPTGKIPLNKKPNLDLPMPRSGEPTSLTPSDLKFRTSAKTENIVQPTDYKAPVKKDAKYFKQKASEYVSTLDDASLEDEYGKILNLSKQFPENKNVQNFASKAISIIKSRLGSLEKGVIGKSKSERLANRVATKQKKIDSSILDSVNKELGDLRIKAEKFGLDANDYARLSELTEQSNVLRQRTGQGFVEPAIGNKPLTRPDKKYLGDPIPAKKEIPFEERYKNNQQFDIELDTPTVIDEGSLYQTSNIYNLGIEKKYELPNLALKGGKLGGVGRLMSNAREIGGDYEKNVLKIVRRNLGDDLTKNFDEADLSKTLDDLSRYAEDFANSKISKIKSGETDLLLPTQQGSTKDTLSLVSKSGRSILRDSGENASDIARLSDEAKLLQGGVEVKAQREYSEPVSQLSDAEDLGFIDIAEGKVQPVTDAQRRLFAFWDKFRTQAKTQADELGLNIGEIDNYYPQVLSKELRDISDVKKLRAAIVLRLKGKYSDADIDSIIRDVKKYDTASKKGFFEKTRDITLPRELRETRASEIIPYYVKSVAKRFSEAKKFGANNEILNHRLIKAIIENPKDIDVLIETVNKSIKGDVIINDLADNLSKLQVFTKMTMSAISNVYDIVPIAVRYGAGRTMKNYLKQIFLPSARNNAVMSGAAYSATEEAVSNLAGKGGLVKDFLELVQFSRVQRLNNRATVASAIDTAKAALNRLKKNPNNMIARSVLEDLVGKDLVGDVLKKGITEDAEVAIGVKSLMVSPLDTPPKWKDSWMSNATQFKSSIYRASGIIKQNIKNDMARGDYARVGNRIATLILFGNLVGASGRKVKDVVKSAISGQENDKEFNDYLWEIGQNLMEVGTAGIYGGFLNALEYGQYDGIALVSGLIGPSFGDMTRLAVTAYQFGSDSEEKPRFGEERAKDAIKKVLKISPILDRASKRLEFLKAESGRRKRRKNSR